MPSGTYLHCSRFTNLLTLLSHNSKLSIDEDDIALIFEDLHRGRTVLPPFPVPNRPALVRWDPQRPLSVENCVVFEHKDAERHEKECYYASPARRPEEVWGKEVAAVQARRAEEIRRERDAVF